MLGAAVLLCGAVVPARAQRVVGPWEDGSIAPRGVLRVGITPRFEQWNKVFDANGTTRTLGSQFTGDLGATYPYVAPLVNQLAIVTGSASLPLSFGVMQSRIDVTQARTDIALDYGVTSRLGVLALIPYVKNRVHVLTSVNDGATAATLGFNPGVTVAGAKQQNEGVVMSISTAATFLESELTRCMGSADASCATINANRQAATALVTRAESVSGALATAYGTTTVTGSLYAPVAGSALASSIDAALTTLNTQFRALLGAPTTGEWITGRPVGAVPIGATGLADLLGDTASGVLARPLGDYEHSHVGDIEVGAKFLILDTFGPVATSPLPRAGAIRLSVAGVYRLGTGQLDLPGDFTDVGTGDRQADLELRGFGDIAVGSRFWISSVLRLGIQNGDRIVRRIPGSDADLFPELAREVEVDRNLGDVMEFEVAPRYVPNDEFSIAGLYRYRSKGADSYDGTFQVTGADGRPLTLNASILESGTTQKEHVLGFSVTYSTVRAYGRRSAKWPLEVSYIHSAVQRGNGVPLMQMNGIGFRFYRPIRGNVLRLPGARR